MNLSVPTHKLASLSSQVREEVEGWMKLLHLVNDCRDRGIVLALKRVARENAVAFATLRTKWFHFHRRGPEALINKAKNPTDRICLPPAFLTYWRSLMLSHQRDTTGRQAHRELMAAWRAWRKDSSHTPIPGYDLCPTPAPLTAHPHGWSLSNLMRHAPSRYEKRLRRQGTMAAKDLLPSVRTTRVGLQFMEMIMCDDQWHDTYVNLIGSGPKPINSRMMRPLSFNALELLSGCDFARGYKPILWDDKEKKRTMLNEGDAFWFLLYIFSEYGWRTDALGTTVVMEHGTMSVKGSIQQAFERVSNGQIKFSAGGVLGEPLMRGIFAGQPRGNFKFKAHRESWFNLFRNYMSALPGATGLSPEKAPEESYGLNQYNNSLLKAIAKLPPDRRRLLAFPVLEWAQYVPLADAIAELINQRDDHALEGWEALGFLAREVRMNKSGDDWMSHADITALTNPTSQQLALALMMEEGHFRSRRLSPREVFNHCHQQAPMRKLSPHLWHLVIPNEYATEARVSEKHEIVIRDKTVSPTPLVYTSEVRNDKGHRWVLTPGEKIRVYSNPYRPDIALICAPDDSAIGLASLLNRPCRNDLPGWAEVNGKVNSLAGILNRNARHNASSVAADRNAMREYNERVIKGEPVTAEEHESAGRFAEAAEIVEEALEMGADATGNEVLNPEAWL